MIRQNPSQIETSQSASTANAHRSLEGLHGSVDVPRADAGFWKQYRAFVGPALLVSVGYMDPGNWGTDLQAGAQFKYGLLWVVGLSSLMAMVLQICASKLGVVMGKDLAQACRDHYPAWTRIPNWLFCELAIGACDLAEVLGSAVAINLLFGIPLFWAVLITAFDVLLLLSLQGLGMRLIEALILVLISTIGICYFIEIFVLPQTSPSFLEMGRALISPSLGDERMVVLAIGIIGATVMPHNLYLHSALVQSRRFQSDDSSIRKAIQFNTLDSTVALSLAFLVNAAILVLAAMVFFEAYDGQFAEDTDWIRVAYLTLAPLLGTMAASILFAVALLASGQSSTITGTLGWPSGHGRLHALAHSSLAAAALDPRTGDYAGAGNYRPSRRQQRHRLARSQPSGLGDSTPARHVSVDASHQLATLHGPLRKWLVLANRGLDRDDPDHGPGFLWTSRYHPGRLEDDHGRVEFGWSSAFRR